MKGWVSTFLFLNLKKQKLSLNKSCLVKDNWVPKMMHLPCDLSQPL